MAYLDVSPSSTVDGTDWSAVWQQVKNDGQAAADFIRARWTDFVGMDQRILDLQHRAATTAWNLSQQGSILANVAHDLVSSIGKLYTIHGKTVAKVQEYGGALGIQGLGAVVTTISLVVLTGLAVLMVWVYMAYAAYQRKLDMIEAGQLPPDSLEPPPSPTGVLGGVGSLVKWGVIALLVYVGLEAVRAFRPNPALGVFRSNPPTDDPEDVFGEDVYAIYYRHAQDGLDYVHDFDDGVVMESNPDGSITLWRPDGKRLWEDF